MDHITDMGEAALAKLTSQYADKQKMRSMVLVFAELAQLAEDAVFQVASLSVDAETGAQLDGDGLLIGQPREGRADADYRPWIKARIRINRGSATPPEIISAFKVLVPGAIIIYMPKYPAGFYLRVSAAISSDLADQLGRILRTMKPGGVEVGLEWTGVAEAETFAFAGPGTGAGFGTTSNPAVGGKLSGLA